jgi:NAD(P)-dependent dehydrogenase (short-subunit alcohol dehydrogenase family)
METRLLQGRRALVTGPSRGIGAETARAMARAGAAVALAIDGGKLAGTPNPMSER